MQMRRAELPKNSHRQRLAASGIAKALCRVFLSLSRAENQRILSFRAESRNSVAEPGGNFPGCLDFARHDSAVYETSSPRACTSTEGSIFSAGLNFANGLGDTGWLRLEFWCLDLGSVCWAIIGLRA